ncbi:ABC transporter permease [Streptomyces sp. NPDC021224]|uniref:ABC transporter permease n=1 Tax=unclassified Streptomyces TaxID=2593676 RepID=UPI0037B4DA43
MLRFFGYLFLRYRRTWRGSFFVSVLNPVLFLVGIGAGLGHLVDRHAPAQLAGAGYAAFFAPGMLAAATMQTAYLEASWSVTRAAFPGGAYQDAAPTPLDPEEVMSGHMLYVLFRVVSSSAAFVCVMAAADLVSVARAAGVLAAATLTGVAFATPTAAWAVGVRVQRRTNTVFRMVIMPMYMFSGSFFALDQLPGPVRVAVEALPLAQGVELCRSLALGTAGALATAGHAAYLCVLAGAGYVIARTTYRRRLHA